MAYKIICPNCRRVVGTHERFCTNCGIPNVVSPQEAAILGRRQFWRRLIRSLLLFLVLGVFVVAVAYFGRPLYTDFSIMQRGVSTQGKVMQSGPVRCESDSFSRTSPGVLIRHIYPGTFINVRFQDLHQQVHLVSFSTCQDNLGSLTTGSSATVVYLPDQPDVAVLHGKDLLDLLRDGTVFILLLVFLILLFFGRRIGPILFRFFQNLAYRS